MVGYPRNLDVYVCVLRTTFYSLEASRLKRRSGAPVLAFAGSHPSLPESCAGRPCLFIFVHSQWMVVLALLLLLVGEA